MNYEDALRFLNGRLRLGVKLGNERFLALLEMLGNPHEMLRVVHIGGTKGKGSTATMAASILRSAGYRVGQYLSPYVYDVRERVQINGQLIPREDFARWVTRIEPHVAALENTEFGPVTEFELKTALGLCWFAEQSVDYAVLEVGLGGRLDATNVIARPLVTVITNIGLDHTELLGDTLGLIAGEKAGIIKQGVPCVTGVPIQGEADAVISRVCEERNAPLWHLGDEVTYGIGPKGGLTITTPRRSVSGLRLRLPGAFQHGNAALAVGALDAIDEQNLSPLADDTVRQGLETAFLPGRLEKIADHPTVVADAAHNALSANALAEALRTEFGAAHRRLIFVVGLSRHHDPESFLEPLAALHPAATIATQPAFRPREAEDVAAAAQHWHMGQVTAVTSSVADAARAALTLAGPDDIVCLTGSFYTVGDVPPALWSQLISDTHPKRDS